ncbi:MAG: hypothetical protein KC609_10500 [Myxococcales bacterium]|nr:hypothetical protein [Myxococcales bacterium]
MIGRLLIGLLVALVLEGCSAPTRDDAFVPPIGGPAPDRPAPPRRPPSRPDVPAPETPDTRDAARCVPALVVRPSQICRNKPIAKHYYQLGLAAYGRKDYLRAAVMFYRANHFCPANANAYNIARAYRSLRLNRCASRHLEAYLESLRLSHTRLPSSSAWIRAWIRRYPPL